MLDFLFLISAKPVVVTLAIIGAILATLSAAIENFFTNNNTDKDTGRTNFRPVSSPYRDDSPQNNEQPRPRASFGSWLNRLGYGIMGISVVLFIIAGFIVDLRG